MTNMLFSALLIARILSDPAKAPLIPTEEQRAIIETPPIKAVLVVAGAGSGKTETISNRVVWLVANGHVTPGEVLGLTFTRKAAGELAHRVRGRLLTFVERARNEELTDEQHTQILMLHDALTTSLDLPEVSTYNAFAVSLVQEFGAASGIGGQLIDEAIAWGIARDVVVQSTDKRLAEFDASITALTEGTLSLEHALHDHLSTPEAVRVELEGFQRVRQLPYDEKALDKGIIGEKVYAPLTAQIKTFERTLAVVDLAEQYSTKKRERGLLEFSDQVALALETLTSSPDSKALLRKRHRVILLDEVQDTSVAQTRLLAAIFNGMHVMAVGDPHQSIYGWRGASTESLSGFHAAFQDETAPNRTTLTLSTSWRNSVQVLNAANRAALPLRVTSAVTVPTLLPRKGAPEGIVTSHYSETLQEEAEYVAEWFADRREIHAAAHDGEYPTAAIIIRKRKYMTVFAEALASRGIPARIIGLGGLLSTPEVRDLVSTLRCVWYADASNDLIRLLTGPRFAIGVSDIKGLRGLARWFTSRDHTQKRIDTDTAVTQGALESLDREVSLVDALDLLNQLSTGHPALSHISEIGEGRLREAAQLLHRLRKLISSDVHDIMHAAITELRLDIELESHERYTLADSAIARENLQALSEEVRGFLRISPGATLRTVLEWLEHSERDDALPAYVPPPEHGTVQLITVHSSKGLEWDLVAIPRQGTGEFPSKPRDAKGELKVSTIPDVCRGDASSRPVFAWRNAETQKEVRDGMNAYTDEQKTLHYEEELRLVYVAYTRAKDELLLTGSFWSTNKTVAPPSAPLLALRGQYVGAYEETRFEAQRQSSDSFQEFIDTPLIGEIPTESTTDEPPEKSEDHSLTWPLDPLGIRRNRVLEAAQAVSEASLPNKPDELVTLLLADERRVTERGEEGLFQRINASSFHDFIADPIKARARLLRPLPQRPYRRTRVGNLFHDWVEQRTTTPIGTGLDLGIDDLFEGSITDTEKDEVERLIEVFENSRWATRQPIMVEKQITIPFAGRRVVCKLDAVYTNDGRVEIVDWKTGRSPKTKKEREDRFLQLDLYRIAYSLHTSTALEDIDVSLFYVEENFELKSEEHRDLETLEKLWKDAYSTL